MQIVGTGLVPGAIITFGGAAAALTGWSPSGNLINVVTPPHAAGTVDVVVTYHGQSSLLAGGFTYGFAAPVSIDAISSSAGPTAGGTYLLIQGTGFQLGTTARLDGAPARVIFVNSTSISLATRPHPPGTVALVVTTPDGQSDTLAGGFTYVAPRSFDFNGLWEGRLGDETETAFSFRVEHDRLVSVSCATTVTFSSPPSTSTGEFAAGDSRGSMTGGLLDASSAAGTISLRECTNYETAWYATKR